MYSDLTYMIIAIVVNSYIMAIVLPVIYSYMIISHYICSYDYTLPVLIVLWYPWLYIIAIVIPRHTCSSTQPHRAQVPRDLPGRPTPRRRGALGPGPAERRKRRRHRSGGAAAAGDPGGLGAFQSRGPRGRRGGVQGVEMEKEMDDFDELLIYGYTMIYISEKKYIYIHICISVGMIYDVTLWLCQR